MCSRTRGLLAAVGRGELPCLLGCCAAVGQAALARAGSGNWQHPAGLGNQTIGRKHHRGHVFLTSVTEGGEGSRQLQEAHWRSTG